MEKLNNIFFTLMSRGPDGMVKFQNGVAFEFAVVELFYRGSLKKLLDLDA